MIAFAEFGNPAQDIQIIDFIFYYLKALSIALLPLGILAIIFAGAMFVFARGSESGIKNAKKFFLKALLFVIGLIALVYIVELILSFINSVYEVLSK